MKSQNGDRKPRIGTLLPAIAGWQRRHWVITLIFVDLAGFWIPNYAVRAKIELLLLYLKKLNETRCKKHIS